MYLLGTATQQTTQNKTQDILTVLRLQSSHSNVLRNRSDRTWHVIGDYHTAFPGQHPPGDTGNHGGLAHQKTFIPIIKKSAKFPGI